MQLLQFLKLVLPGQGHYCWVTIKDKKAKQGFVATIEELEKKLLEEDAKGIDVYFACSSFLQPGSRQFVNVHSTKAFWFDIDAGPGKPYKDADEAFTALEEFCAKTGLPKATIVCSGNGIHAWWPLEHSLEPKEWKEHAERLKRLSEAHGLDVDPTRTSDLASILRAPGTHNYKRPESPREVEVWDFEGEEHVTSPVSRFSGVDLPRVDIVKDWDKIKEKNNELSLERGYPDGQRTQALVRLAGHLLGNLLKSPSVDETVAALLHWNSFNMPPMPEDKIRSTVASIAKSETQKRAAQAGSIGNLPRLPGGYKWDARGRMLTSVPIKETDEWEEVAVTEFPLYLFAVSRKEREFTQAYFFRQWLPKEGWRDFQVLCSDFESQSWRGHMAKNGGNCVLNDKLFKSYVHNADAELRRTEMDAIRYQQFGWKNDNKSFLVGDVMIHDTGKIEKIYGSEEIAHRMKQMTPAKGGSLAAWSADANCLFGDSYIHFGYALIASFASVLLNLCMDQSDGGIVLSIISSGSGRGKSKLLEAASSVWGQLEALQITPRDTVNAKFSLIATASHLPIFMDEWNERDPQVVANFVKQYTVGHDKNRAQRDGSVIAKPAEYKNLLMTTSNSSLLDTVRASHDEGAIARVVEITAPEIEGESFKRLGKITSQMLNNHGYAGREFIYQLMQPEVLDSVKSQLNMAVEHFRTELNTSGKHRYVAWLPAAVLVAAGLLKRNGILEFDIKRIMEWSLQQAAQRIEEGTPALATEILSAFIAESFGQCLMVSGPFVGNVPLMVLNNMGNIPSRIIMRSERDSKRLIISTDALRAWTMKNGRSYNDLVKGLERQGVLVSKRRLVTLGAGTIASMGRVYCLDVDMSHPAMGGSLIEVKGAQVSGDDESQEQQL